MLKWTDRHARYFLRLISPHALLYTEMVTTGALIFGDSDRHISYNREEHPVALQLGGSNPDHLTRCAQMAEQAQYDEVNLNIGCPSDRVQSGRFGACLMAEPQLVGDCVAAMQKSVGIPITVKCRIGVDDNDSYEFLQQFVDVVANAGCNTIIVHARKALLEGLSPKQNREIPPLKYEFVYRIKEDFPQLTIILNGGVTTTEQCQTHLQHVDGVMVGRGVYQNPYMLSEVENQLFNDVNRQRSRSEVLQAFLPYVESQLSQGIALNQLSRHILGLFQGVPGAKAFRRHISEKAHLIGSGIEVLEDALNLIEQAP